MVNEKNQEALFGNIKTLPMSIKFGSKQLQNPTPANVARRLDIFCAISGVLIGYLTTASYIPNNISNIIAGILGMLIGVAQSLKPFYGVETTRQTVDIDNVVEMEKPKDK